MMDIKNKNYLLTWIEKQQSLGRYVFNLDQLRTEFIHTSREALNLALSRLSKKGRIISIYKGFYLIISPEYSSRGIIPPVQFIDDLMKFTGKSYYVGLLSAAALYGAAHQQPQEFFVITTLKQSITREKNLKINYITKKTIPFDFIKKIQTESGFVNVSSPQLTASDLIYYSKQIGGINRVCTVLNELCESLNPDDFTGHFIEILTIPTIQRLGFIFEKILFKNVLSDRLYDEIKKTKKTMFRQPLATNTRSTGCPVDKKWQIIINTEIDFEE